MNLATTDLKDHSKVQHFRYKVDHRVASECGISLNYSSMEVSVSIHSCVTDQSFHSNKVFAIGKRVKGLFWNLVGFSPYMDFQICGDAT